MLLKIQYGLLKVSKIKQIVRSFKRLDGKLQLWKIGLEDLLRVGQEKVMFDLEFNELEVFLLFLFGGVLGELEVQVCYLGER